jgi:cellulose biosynthesis protein BcsQ
MLIIIEGMDNTGKSTLAKQLAEDLQIDLRHSKGKDIDMSDNLLDIYWDSKKGHLITDRINLISEVVYGPILRNQNKLEKTKKIWWEIYDSLEIVIIYCRPSLGMILQSMSEREQMEGVIDNTEQLLLAYDREILQLEKDKKPIFRYNYIEDNYEEVLKMLKIAKNIADMKEEIFAKIRRSL